MDNGLFFLIYLDLEHLPKSEINYVAIKLVNWDHKGNTETHIAIALFLVERTLVERIIQHYTNHKRTLGTLLGKLHKVFYIVLRG